MISQIATFCTTRRIHRICFECERHIRHETNKQFLSDKQTVMEYIPSTSTIQGLTCIGEIVYPKEPMES